MIDAVQRSWERTPRRASRRSSRAHVGLDMAEWWAPTRESYFAHVSKALILEAVRDGVSEKDADALAGLKKDPMIEHAERLLSGRRWLPAVLRNGNARFGIGVCITNRSTCSFQRAAFFSRRRSGPFSCRAL